METICLSANDFQVTAVEFLIALSKCGSPREASSASPSPISLISPFEVRTIFDYLHDKTLIIICVIDDEADIEHQSLGICQIDNSRTVRSEIIAKKQKDDWLFHAHFVWLNNQLYAFDNALESAYSNLGARRSLDAFGGAPPKASRLRRARFTRESENNWREECLPSAKMHIRRTSPIFHVIWNRIYVVGGFGEASFFVGAPSNSPEARARCANYPDTSDEIEYLDPTYCRWQRMIANGGFEYVSFTRNFAQCIMSGVIGNKIYGFADKTDKLFVFDTSERKYTLIKTNRIVHFQYKCSLINIGESLFGLSTICTKQEYYSALIRFDAGDNSWHDVYRMSYDHEKINIYNIQGLVKWNGKLGVASTPSAELHVITYHWFYGLSIATVNLDLTDRNTRSISPDDPEVLSCVTLPVPFARVLTMFTN
ncbi:MAG: hypothetical protein M0R33_19020 [Methylomonas sp.]|jgi:hypothetical protein|uniref:hypothetical protein n=1 Tax=Methylomonas sp. TaxID=418 RepID=UPI0025EB3556|nr:hypothetical protein [Methylomonas sp.]MCK9608538.1 hypothetical protein [Methylomonas sp.]